MGSNGIEVVDVGELNGGTHVESGIEPVSQDALATMERVAIDSQIATAKRYPRSISLFIERAQMMACVDEETAKSCFYRRPVGKEGGKQVYAEGEGIRFAEIVAASFDNLAVRAIIVEITPRYVKAVGMARDLERNYMAAAECVESTVDKRGVPYSERQRMLIAKVAQSKAFRDAIFKVVPRALCRPIASAAQEVALGKGLTLDQRRERVMQWIMSLNISPERVWRALGIAGPEDMGTSEMLTLTGIRSAIKDGDTNFDEAFPVDTPAGQANVKNGNAAVLDKLKGRREQSSNGADSNKPSAEAGAGDGAQGQHESAQAEPSAPPANVVSAAVAEKTADPAVGQEPRDTSDRDEPGLYTCTACGWTGDKTRRNGNCPACGATKDKVAATADLIEEADPNAFDTPATNQEIAAAVDSAKPAEKMNWRCLNPKCGCEYAEKPAVCKCGSHLGFKAIN